jgi:hypothetical protein
VGAATADPAPTDLLPDIDQSPPDAGDIHLNKVAGQWRLSFGSEIYNRGAGPIKLHGERADTSTATMPITQVVSESDGSTRSVVVGGALQYVTANHNHWHVLGLEHYELRALSDPGTVVSDHKTGFCMSDLSPNNCQQDAPDALSVDEGIRVSTGPTVGFDYYLPTLEGQYVDVDPVTTPAGRYDLTHRSNVDHALLESNYANNAASAEIQLDWSSDGTPSVEFLQSCPDSGTCEEPPAPPSPDPQPTPQPQPSADPQPTPPDDSQPFVPPLTVEQTALGPKLLLARIDAVRLMREAIRRAQGRSPRALEARCHREGSARFACRGGWTLGGTRWAGGVEVWERVEGRGLAWFFTLKARHGAERVRLVRERGGARAAWAAAVANRDLFCHRVAG